MSPSTRGKYQSFDAIALHRILLTGHSLGARKPIAPPGTNKLNQRGNADRCRPGCPRRNRTRRVGAPRLLRLKPRCQPLSNFYMWHVLASVELGCWLAHQFSPSKSHFCWISQFYYLTILVFTDERCMGRLHRLRSSAFGSSLDSAGSAFQDGRRG